MLPTTGFSILSKFSTKRALNQSIAFGWAQKERFLEIAQLGLSLNPDRVVATLYF